MKTNRVAACRLARRFSGAHELPLTPSYAVSRQRRCRNKPDEAAATPSFQGKALGAGLSQAVR
ncbi:MAG: hypothetical protein HY231_25810 [Acidobacteria bacterium]|nr:hypothetical protein [Acidobacteriota bacterium]